MGNEYFQSTFKFCMQLGTLHSCCHGNNDCLFKAWGLIFIQKRRKKRVNCLFLYLKLNTTLKIGTSTIINTFIHSISLGVSVNTPIDYSSRYGFGHFCCQNYRSFVINMYVITMALHCISPWNFHRSPQRRRKIGHFSIYQQISAHSK